MMSSGEDGCKATQEVGESSNVPISVRHAASQPLKVPPPVSAKPAKTGQHPSTTEAAAASDFPPPPAEILMPTSTDNEALSIEEEFDALTEMLARCLQDTNEPGYFGVCHKCHNTISGEGSGCTAMGEMYHVTCFVCGGCETKLTGLSFYWMSNTPYCDKCYENSLEVCVVCKSKITQAIIKAVGNSYHSHCFACVGCDKNLDGIPFSQDVSNAVYCVDCYQLMFSPRCGACQNLILPPEDGDKIVHIVSMEKNFHVECYKCEDCEALLYSDDGRGCYPLDGHLLCQKCNVLRANSIAKKPLTREVSTEL